MTQDRLHLVQLGAEHLSHHDPLLAPIIAQVGPCTVEPHHNYYHQLVSSIIGQQLSVKAAAKIRERFLALFDTSFPSPEAILALDDETLRGVGFSRAKVAYIKDLAERILAGQIKIDYLDDLSNDEVITELTAVKGIGVWTAHMFMLFSLGRLDILATGDLGVRMAAQRLYQLEHLPAPTELEALAERNHWQPYASLACWYLWRTLDNEPT